MFYIWWFRYFILLAIMPTSHMIRLPDIYEKSLKEHIFDMFDSISNCITLLYLSIGIIIFNNIILTLLLLTWLASDYGINILEFGFCTIISQLISIIFTYYYKYQIGIGWSIISGIFTIINIFINILF